MASMDDVPNLRDLHVLVLDDHQDTLDVFSTALRACNANVFTARTARDAVTIFKTVRLDAIVSDLAMPGEDGLWVVDQLRRLSVTKGGSVPALAVTAHWDKDTSKDEAGRSVGVMHDRRIPGGGGADADCAMKEEILGVLKANPAMFYCRICISRLLQVAHAEVQNVLSSFAVTHPTIQFTQGHCVKCGGLRTVFRYMPSTGV